MDAGDSDTTEMGVLTGTRHGDAANDLLLASYGGRVTELEETGQYFMAALALAFALEIATETHFAQASRISTRIAAASASVARRQLSIPPTI
jgi:hypothetical protein